jgi:hypothetical protein
LVIGDNKKNCEAEAYLIQNRIYLLTYLREFTSVVIPSTKENGLSIKLHAAQQCAGMLGRIWSFLFKRTIKIYLRRYAMSLHSSTGRKRKFLNKSSVLFFPVIDCSRCYFNWKPKRKINNNLEKITSIFTCHW